MLYADTIPLNLTIILVGWLIAALVYIALRGFGKKPSIWLVLAAMAIVSFAIFYVFARLYIELHS